MPVTLADPGKICPFHKEDVSKVCHTCPMWVMLRGINPNTGKEIDEWGCSFAFLPALLIENANQARSTGAAIESFRNETVKANTGLAEVMLAAVTTAARAAAPRALGNGSAPPEIELRPAD